MSRVRAVLKNTVYQGVTRLVGVITGLITFAILTRYLGPEQFGGYSTALTYVGVLAAIADLGMPVLLLRMIALRRRSDERHIANLNTLRLLSVALVFAIGLAIAFFLPYNPAIKTGISITCLGFIMVNLTQYLAVVFQEKLRTHLSGAADSFGRVLILVITIIGIHRQASLFWFFWAFVLGSIVSFLGTYLLSRALFKLHFSFGVRDWRPLLKQALPLMLVSLFSLVYFKVDTLILSLLDSSYVVGVYSAAYKYIDVFVTIPAIFGGLALPFFARSTAGQDETRFARQFERSLRLILMAGGLLAAVTFVESGRFITLFSGPEYTDSILVLRILSVAILPLFLGSLCSTALIARNRSSLVAWLFGTTAIASLVLYITTIQRFSLYGAALSTVLVETSIAAGTIIALKRSAIVALRWHVVFGYIASVFALGSTLYVANSLPLAATLACGIAVYGVLLILFRVVEKEEISHVLRGTKLPDHTARFE
ncbi:MAG: flippase [Candidatus Andersenbacteria bacterium]